MSNNKCGYKNDSTICIHAGKKHEDVYGALHEPIYMTNNYKLPADGAAIDWSGINTNIYARNGNINQYVLQEKLAAIESAEACVIFGSGVSALAGLFMTFLSKGDHVICSKVCYSAVTILFKEILPEKFDIQASMVDTTNIEEIKAAIRPDTKLIHIETPGNPTTGISDIEEISKIAKSNNSMLSVDGTFASPISQKPLALGADIVMHSMTKYINGHGDSLGGCLLGNKDLIDKLKRIAMVNFGGVLSPFNAWLISRGMITLPLRMRQHSDSAQKVAEFLQNHPLVRFVHYPGLKNHPQHELAIRQMQNGFGGMISFDIKGGSAAHLRFLNNLKLICHAVSLGDAESILVYTDSKGDKIKYYPEIYNRGFFRFSVGLENSEDIIGDIEQALKYCNGN